LKKLAFIIIVILVSTGLFFLVKSYFYHPSFYPIKSGVCAWAGETQILNSTNTISKSELKKLQAILQPGDLIVNRKDYYVSNYAIPGFWTHTSLYIGTSKVRAKFFRDDVQCTEWVKTQGVTSGNLGELFSQTYDSKFPSKKHKWKEKSIVEAVGKGVIISSFESGASKDGIVVLRPSISKLSIAKGIYNALGMVYMPYDYNFDFSSASEIACTELIYKAFEKDSLFPVNELLGNPFTTAHDITEIYVNNKELMPNLSLLYIYYEGNSFLSESSDEALINLKASLEETVLW